MVAARIVSRTTDTDTDTKRTNYLGSAQTKYTWHDGRYARAHMDRGGLIHAHLEGVGLKARPLTTNSRYQTESFMSPTICTCATFLRDTSAQGYVPEPLSSVVLEGLGTRVRGYITKLPQNCSYNSLLAAYPLLTVSIFSVECKLRGILLKCAHA